jgi:hypothetical protein
MRTYLLEQAKKIAAIWRGERQDPNHGSSSQPREHVPAETSVVPDPIGHHGNSYEAQLHACQWRLVDCWRAHRPIFAPNYGA